MDKTMKKYKVMVDEQTVYDSFIPLWFWYTIMTVIGVLIGSLIP